MKQLLSLLVALLCSAAIYGQNSVTVSGTITDPDGLPLIGATVIAQGTSVGTVADIDGNYELTVPATVTDLVYSFTGYETQTITLSGQTIVDVVMSEGVALDEVVVTGYAVTSKRQTTGAISTVSAEELTAIPSGNVEQQLQGRAAGVTVITNGQPGTQSIIRVRGFGSFGGNNPLYVVDGVPQTNIDFLSPDDIQNTSILKDAASASIYGARAANGVVVIQTKRGSQEASPLKVTYNGLTGFTDPGSGNPILTPQQDATKTWEAIRNTAAANGVDPVFNHPQYGTGETPVIPDYIMVGATSGYVGEIDVEDERTRYNIDPASGDYYQVVRANKEGTDWYDAITRTAMVNRHTLGFSGSTDATRYYVSLGAQIQEGILLNNDFERYTARMNTEFDLGSKVRFGQNLQFTHRKVLGLTGGGGGAGSANEENQILSAFRLNPLIPVRDIFGGYAGTAAQGFGNPRNPVAEREGLANNQSFENIAFGNLYLEFEPIESLVLRSSFGGKYVGFNGRSYGRRTYENAENIGSFSYSEFQGYSTDWIWSNTATYTMDFGAHNLNVLGGVEALEIGNFRSSNGSGINPFSESVDFVSLNNVDSRVVTSGFTYGSRFYSLFGQVNYNFNDKYYLTGVLRRDGSSRFGADNRYGTFPAISAAWRVTAEPFMQNQTFFADLKIRGGWGQMGNSNNVSGDNRFNLFGTGLGPSSYDIGGTNSSAVAGFYRSRIGTETARWETSVTSNIGFDATLLGGNFDVIVDIWRKETNDLLVQLAVPNVLGPSATPPSINVGSMLNEGIDAQLIYRTKIAGDFGIEATINGAILNNEITKFTDDVDFFDSNVASPRISGTIVRNQVGMPLSSFFGYNVVGLFQSDLEVQNAPDQEGAAPGRFRFEDNNSRDENGELTGIPDGQITEADRTFLGSAVPDFTGGVNLRFDYKGFDLTTFFYTSLGGEVYNYGKWFTDFYGTFVGAAVSTRVLDSWTPQNPSTNVPIYENISNFSTSTESSSYYVESADYLRLQNISLGYSFPDDSFRGFVSTLRVAISANNLFTISGYDGLDPAVGGAADTLFGVDLGNYPVTRGYNLALTVGF
ncbi:TonB-linked SusC/RagA family outer membrane protein [Neolewinella xylanilytica]|uniref:TonB-linked SusC/RagA family outer membrane protein n=1 Tax=Neolewinella xylanilytica TaxID=1514080 RepID=A0A2S6I972_9BACT|nr:SusC/RagA family TonB-linked outer membrane protein [Neolewinella xylanilytica]PPK88019.1 TonB-linked SusC/RagA family outer membrane protein [Neolewinella xylanilytica]